MTIAIAFAPGTYGTYLEWCLSSLTSDTLLNSPLTKVGNSHNFKGAHLITIDGWKDFLSASSDAPFVRFHPKHLKEHDLSKNLDSVCRDAQSVIYIYPHVDHVLLCVNNFISKIWKDWWACQLIHTIDRDVIYQNWPVSIDTPLEKIPLWIKREFLSYYLMPAWFDQVEWYHLDTWTNPKACIVTTKDLLFEFESTLTKIQNHCKLNYVKPISSLLPHHRQNLELQANLLQDQLCKKIINCVLSDTSFSWDKLPLGSESWLQWELRNRGWEIRCDGLNEFPTNSLDLNKILYPVT